MLVKAIPRYFRLVKSVVFCRGAKALGDRFRCPGLISGAARFLRSSESRTGSTQSSEYN
jgi:hypothetical protein